MVVTLADDPLRALRAVRFAVLQVLNRLPDPLGRNWQINALLCQPAKQFTDGQLEPTGKRRNR
jgi:hypothetical protein